MNLILLKWSFISNTFHRFFVYFFFFTEGDQNCLKQLVAAITTRLFNPDNVRDRNWDLSSHNTILALGHIAVTLHTQVPSDDIGRFENIILFPFRF